MKSYRRTVWIIFLLIGVVYTWSSAQTSPFKGGILIGFNAAQIDGDDLRGFDKLGFNFGLRFLTDFHPRMGISFDFLYSLRGSQSPLVKDNASFQTKYNLHYLEVPVLFHFREWAVVSQENISYKRIQISGGLAYSRLIRARVYGSPFENNEQHLNKNDISYIVGFGLHTTPSQSFQFRYNDSLNFLFNINKSDFPYPRNLRGYFLTLHYIYLI